MLQHLQKKTRFFRYEHAFQFQPVINKTLSIAHTHTHTPRDEYGNDTVDSTGNHGSSDEIWSSFFKCSPKPIPSTSTPNLHHLPASSQYEQNYCSWNITIRTSRNIRSRDYSVIFNIFQKTLSQSEVLMLKVKSDSRGTSAGAPKRVNVLQ